MFEAVARCSEVIQNNYLFYFELLDQIFRIHNPRKICRSNAILDYRTGHAKTRSFDALAGKVRSGLPEKLLHDTVKLRKFLACKSLSEDRSEHAVLLGKQREVTLRSAHVPSKDHQCPLNLL